MSSWDWGLLVTLFWAGAVYPFVIWIQRLADNENKRTADKGPRATIPGMWVLILIIFGLFCMYSCSENYELERHQLEKQQKL